MLYTLSLCVVRLIICHCCLLVLLSIVCIVVLSVTWTTCFFSVAEADPWDQGLPPHREEEGCPVCEDQEEQRCRQVQGPLLQVLVHPLRLRRWEGKQVEAVSPTRFDRPGGLNIQADILMKYQSCLLVGRAYALMSSLELLDPKQLDMSAWIFELP